MSGTACVTNEEKRNIYAELKTRLKIALGKEFYYEAVMIEYAIIEDRTASILSHGGVCKDPWDKKLQNKLNSIRHQCGKKHPILSKKVDVALLDQIYSWKERRNELVHRSCTLPYAVGQMKEIAEEGNELVRLLTNCARRVSNAASCAQGQ